MATTKIEREKQKQERLGEVNYNKNGYKMTIIEYNNCDNIIVKFEDGNTFKSTYSKFKSKGIRKPENRLGEVGYNNNKERMVIVEYNSSIDITVEFDDGIKVFNVTYSRFKKGAVAKPIENRIGEVNYNNFGSKMTIIEYIDSSNIVVQFDNGYITKAKYQHFQNKQVKSPYCKSVYGIGYIGEGDYKVSINGKVTTEYRTWIGVLERCYSTSLHKKYPTYIGCTVDPKWHNFQNFAKFWSENYYELEGERTHLDKDILCKGNKIYSENTSIFTPQRINDLFVKKDINRGKYPIGVGYNNEENNKYRASCNSDGRLKHLGYYDTIEEAFLAYKEEKERYIKQVADEYKGKIPQKLYDALYRYEVHITD